MTTREISNRTGIPIRILSTVLPRGIKKNIFERKEKWGWVATPFGFFVLSINNNNNYNTYTTQQQHNNNTNTTRIQHELSTVPQDPYQLNLNFFNELNLTETERGVVGVVMAHYKQTRRPFIKGKSWADLGMKLNLTELDDDEIQDLLVNLEVKGIFYMKRIGQYMKVGLLKDFIERFSVHKS